MPILEPLAFPKLLALLELLAVPKLLPLPVQPLADLLLEPLAFPKLLPLPRMEPPPSLGSEEWGEGGTIAASLPDAGAARDPEAEWEWYTTLLLTDGEASDWDSADTDADSQPSGHSEKTHVASEQLLSLQPHEVAAESRPPEPLHTTPRVMQRWAELPWESLLLAHGQDANVSMKQCVLPHSGAEKQRAGVASVEVLASLSTLSEQTTAKSKHDRASLDAVEAVCYVCNRSGPHRLGHFWEKFGYRGTPRQVHASRCLSVSLSLSLSLSLSVCLSRARAPLNWVGVGTWG